MRTNLLAVCVAILSVGFAQAQSSTPDSQELVGHFLSRTGATLAFREVDLPKAVYHDLMVPLSAERRVAAAKIAVNEAAKFPPGFLGKVGIKAIGVFASCASNNGDGFRPYDKELKGYRYYGIYNGHDAIAAAYYTDGQLPLTFHHEIFHHIDALTDRPGQEDLRWTQILDGRNLYPAAQIDAADLALLKKVSKGVVLTDAVSAYAAKNPAEDKAETARHLMSTLPDSLVQIAEQPKLPGSQRILHVLDKYRRVLDGKGPTLDWFVDVALGRQDKSAVRAIASAATTPDARQLAAQLQSYAAGQSGAGDDEARRLLISAEGLAAKKLPPRDGAELTQASAAATSRLLKSRIAPSDNDRRFTVMGREDANGVNWTLRNDIANFGNDAARLAAIARWSGKNSDELARTQLANLRLLSRFYVFIATNWPVSEGTQRLFDQTRDRFALALPGDQAALTERLRGIDLRELAEQITPDGEFLPHDNAYMKKVDEEIRDPRLRAVIRRVQPACVRLGNGSGICISADGKILTAAHVPGRLNAKLSAEFPDGQKFTVKCTAIDAEHDLAICTITTEARLPLATVAKNSPVAGTPVVCIGQPGTQTPSGKPTGYEPFHVSTGQIRGIVGDPLGSQNLGRTKHDAWTYWGHSGSPLFDENGQIVALHNSWDSTTAMRHAVTHQAIVRFLKENGFAAAKNSK
jgi:S1-C subfamily serine protease